MDTGADGRTGVDARNVASEHIVRLAVGEHALPSATAANHLQIRHSVKADREGGRALLRQHYANSVFRAQPFADWKFDAQFDHSVKHPKNTLGLLAEHRGRIVGAVWAVCDQYVLSDDPPLVSVQLIAFEQQAINGIGRTKTFLGLIKAIRQWTTAVSASHAQFMSRRGRIWRRRICC